MQEFDFDEILKNSNITIKRRVKEVRYIVLPTEYHNVDNGRVGVKVYDKLLMRVVYTINSRKNTLEEVLNEISKIYKNKLVRL